MKATLAMAAIVIGCSSVACFATSRLYWGYWVFRPSANWLVSSMVSVERFTTFLCCSPNPSGPSAVQAAATIEFRGAGDDLTGNLPAAMLRRGLEPVSAESVPTELLARIRNSLESRGAVIEGERGYTHAKELWGHVAVGRTTDRSQIVAAALWGGEASNDHHPYYEATFLMSPAGELSMSGMRQYWFDVAGLEGVAHLLGGAVGCIAGVVWSAACLLRRNSRRGLTGAATHD
jgi:hypothetical protein